MADEAQVKRLAKMLQREDVAESRADYLARCLLEAGVKLPEPEFVVLQQGGWWVVERAAFPDRIVAEFYSNTHPAAEAAARAECARLNGEVG